MLQHPNKLQHFLPTLFALRALILDQFEPLRGYLVAHFQALVALQISLLILRGGCVLGNAFPNEISGNVCFFGLLFRFQIYRNNVVKSSARAEHRGKAPGQTQRNASAPIWGARI